MKSGIRIAMVDDHQIVLDGLRALLGQSEDFEIVYTTTNATQMLLYLQQFPGKIDVLITDIMMPEMTGQELAKSVHKKAPEIKILALSMSGTGNIIEELINDADINGYALKNISRFDLESAIRTIAAGGQYFSDEIMQELEKQAHIPKKEELSPLTVREIEIVKCIEKEMSNREIADALFISERTVETHRKNIFRKTRTNGVIGLIKYAYDQKII